MTTILVPGAGEANPDSWQYNPYQTKKQRAETEVRMLLEKCQPETIALDPDILAKLDQNKIEGKVLQEHLALTTFWFIFFVKELIFEQLCFRIR